MIANKLRPVGGLVYTLWQIEKVLYLRDSACLEFTHGEQKAVIQTSHITSEDLLTIPGIASSRWKYCFETHEWVPVFHYVGAEPITNFVDIEQEIGRDGETTKELWVTPKGFPRQQYYVQAAYEIEDAQAAQAEMCEHGGKHDWVKTADKEPIFICAKCKHYMRDGVIVNYEDIRAAQVEAEE